MHRLYYAPCLLVAFLAFGALALKADEQTLRAASAQSLFEAYQDSVTTESDFALAGRAMDQLKMADGWYQLAESELPKKATAEVVSRGFSRNLGFARSHAEAGNYLATQLVARHPAVAMPEEEAAPKKKKKAAPQQEEGSLAQQLLARANSELGQYEALAAGLLALEESRKAYLFRALDPEASQEAAVKAANEGLRAANRAAAQNPDAGGLYELCIEINAKFKEQLRDGQKDWSGHRIAASADERKALGNLAESLIDLSVKRAPKDQEAYLKEQGLLKVKRARPQGLLGVVGEPKPHVVARSTKTLAEWQAFFGVN